MIKQTLIVVMLFLLFANTAIAKDKLNVIMAGSASGSYNSFNNEVVKDLANHYNLNIIAGQSESKGVRMFENFTSGPVYAMVRAGFHNALSALTDHTLTITGLNSHSFVMGIRIYKAFCVKAGNSLEDIFKSGNKLKIGLSDGDKINGKFLENFNRVTNSQNIFVPYDSSGKQTQGVIVGDTDAVLLNVSKSQKFSKKGQITCNYTTNPQGQSGWTSLQQKVNDAWFGWSYSDLLLGTVKNANPAFTKNLHAVFTQIIADPTSHTAKKIAKNNWFSVDMSQADMEGQYKANYTNTKNYIK